MGFPGEDPSHGAGEIAARAMFHEDAHAVFPGAQHRAREIHGITGLTGDGIGHAIGIGVVGASLVAAVEPHPGYRAGGMMMKSVPQFGGG